MSPEEAAGFHEHDEDPRVISTRYDAGPHGFTAPPGAADLSPATQIRWSLDYITATYGPGASQ